MVSVMLALIIKVGDINFALIQNSWYYKLYNFFTMLYFFMYNLFSLRIDDFLLTNKLKLWLLVVKVEIKLFKYLTFFI